MDYSNFGTKFTQPNGITQLMEDLGDAKNSNNPNIVMLGGGNPALVPEVNNIFINPCVSLNFTSTIDSELGDIDIQSFNFIVSNIFDNNIEVEIFPNPVNNILNIKIDRFLDSFDVDLYDVSGKKIKSSYKFTNSNMATIDLTYLTSSVYMLVISNELALTTNLFFKK